MADIWPGAKFIHIVRDPRHVVSSYLFGKGAKGRDSYEKKGDYFTRDSRDLRWSARAFADIIMAIEGIEDDHTFTDVLRILLVWKHKFDVTWRQGRKAFGENYRMLRHEDLVQAPEATIRGLYDFLQLECPADLTEWARNNLRSPSTPFRGDDPQWQACLDKLDMWGSLERAGYDQDIRAAIGAS